MLLRSLILLVLVLPGIGQNEEQPYFSLTSTSTFGSNGKPRISMSAWNVDTLEFRVYRVNDPLKFFRQLEDPHQFGGAVPKPAHTPTLLERIHGWKHDLRTSIRRGLRAQFTEPPSAHFESILPRTATPQREHEGGNPKVRQGIVVSDQADKTITVRIEVARRHRRYEKIVRTSGTVHAHDESNDAHIGDTVVVRECRPLSRSKRWRLVEVVERAK